MPHRIQQRTAKRDERDYSRMISVPLRNGMRVNLTTQRDGTLSESQKASLQRMENLAPPSPTP